jgi:signal transduction histidine kinase/integral membrane sensor domain MASE1
MGTSTASRADTSWLALTQGLRRGPASLPALSVALTALAVGLAYFEGSRLGLTLRFPPATTSLLWPPNAILTATLLLTRSPRRWCIYLAAALPAHLAMLLPTGWPLPFVLALFVTNCSEALIAACALRSLGGAPIRFDTLRRMGLFIAVVVLLAPFVSSFADAAVVRWWRCEAFWPVWRNRFVSNTLTELMLVPACVVAVRDALPMARRASWRRLLEGVLLTVFTVLLGLIVFGSSEAGPLGSGPGLSVRFLALLLAPLLWASVRFGPASTSVSLLWMAVMLLWGETHGRGMLDQLAPEEAALAFQTVLGVIAVPLMCLAALMQEHRKAEELIRGRLDFEKLLSRLSTAFVPLGSHEMEATFESWVARIGESFDVDRFVVVLLGPADDVEVAYSWAAPGLVPLERGHLRADYPGDRQALIQDQLFVIAQLKAAGGDSAQSAWFDRASRSLTVPLTAGGQATGVVSLVRRSDEHDWPEDLVHRLRLVANVLAGALARKGSEDALRESEALKSAILASMPTSVAVLDRKARIVAVNEAWSRSGAPGRSPRADPCEWDLFGVTSRMEPAGLAMALGVSRVLEGALRSFAHEFRCTLAGTERWLQMSAVPLKGASEGGAVVSYTDVTERKHAEIEASQSRQELAHFLRISTVGVMTTSLAHELNQPLTAILANAQAARRMLASDQPDLTEFREMLTDVIDEDRRAGEIISQLREMLRKGTVEPSALDVNTLVGGVARLVGSDALIRKVDLHVSLDPATPSLKGDRTQLQQVVLNLLLNALEAAADAPNGERSVVVRTGRTAAGMVEIAVVDTGPGLPEELAERVFEPFFTTKTRGIGMGLSIARSIVSAHGGSIWAEKRPGGGAVFRLHLPALDGVAKDERVQDET